MSSLQKQSPDRTNIYILIGLIVFLLITSIVIVIMYYTGTGIFGTYVPPPLPNSYQLNGSIKQLTPAEQQVRDANIKGILALMGATGYTG